MNGEATSEIFSHEVRWGGELSGETVGGGGGLQFTVEHNERSDVCPQSKTGRGGGEGAR